MTLEAIIAAETANKEETRKICGNTGIPSTVADADFAVVCDDRAANYRAKAAAVKSGAAKAKWNALADVWASK